MEKIKDFSNDKQPHMPIQEPPAIRHITHNFQLICRVFETCSKFAYVQ